MLPIPLKGKRASQFQTLDATDSPSIPADATPSFHSVTFVTRVVHKGTRRYVKKLNHINNDHIIEIAKQNPARAADFNANQENPEDPAAFEIAAFNSLFYESFLRNHAAKVRAVYNEKGVAEATVSTYEPLFRSLYALRDERYAESRNKSAAAFGEELLNAGLIPIVISALVSEEGDLSFNNLGLVDEQCFLIDHDLATYSISKKYAYKCAKFKEIPINKRNIANPFKLPISNMPSWLGKEDEEQTILFDSLLTNDHYPDLVHFNLLKAALYSCRNFEAFAKATISDESLRQELVAARVRRTEELRNLLLDYQPFKTYLLSHPQAWLQLEEEFSEFNRSHSNPDYAFLHFDLLEMKAEFNNLLEQCGGTPELNVETTDCFQKEKALDTTRGEAPETFSIHQNPATLFVPSRVVENVGSPGQTQRPK